YDTVDPAAPIRQGDVFVRVPRVDFKATELYVFREGREVNVASWDDYSRGEEPVPVLVQVRPVVAIVITQDCDAARARDVSLCEARPFHDVEGRDRNAADTPKKWVRLVTQHARLNQKWFYLPADGAMGIPNRMAVDFRVVIRLALEDLESMKASYRVGRLNDVASAHFRERVAEFFRRYAYDEWYPLTKSEFDYYRNERVSEPVDPFPWQEG